MTPRASKSYLASLRDEIASMRVVKCRMAHERVVESTVASRLPVSCVPLHTFKRVGLCSPGERDERLGCSHTMSRTRLDRAIDELEPERAQQFGHELNCLTNGIHLLDHRKGEAEALLAAAISEAGGGRDGSGTLEVIKAAEEVARLERRHDEYVERAGVLRDKVVSELDRILTELK